MHPKRQWPSGTRAKPKQTTNCTNKNPTTIAQCPMNHKPAAAGGHNLDQHQYEPQPNCASENPDQRHQTCRAKNRPKPDTSPRRVSGSIYDMSWNEMKPPTRIPIGQGPSGTPNENAKGQPREATHLAAAGIACPEQLTAKMKTRRTKPPPSLNCPRTPPMKTTNVTRQNLSDQTKPAPRRNPGTDPRQEPQKTRDEHTPLRRIVHLNLDSHHDRDPPEQTREQQPARQTNPQTAIENTTQPGLKPYPPKRAWSSVSIRTTTHRDPTNKHMRQQPPPKRNRERETTQYETAGNPDEPQHPLRAVFWNPTACNQTLSPPDPKPAPELPTENLWTPADKNTRSPVRGYVIIYV
ncbi:hypothetical protein BS47DRAFT_1369116 [Hydnum rufescens UP504]|uniref:Uncharacterized protein n=1 Tax=Hydnum rufescens UP504 TaxID=1448309 RepID=A0A9P6AE97_9AGAM|nr:hypothetical protein BS47DRAFT_1369116 [Hydnum rufescens UP504]